MSTIKEIKVPDIGDFSDVEIIEILVKPGDSLKAEDPVMTLESDKATMDVPCPEDGQVAELLVKVGGRVAEGTSILKLQAAGASEQASTEVVQAPTPSASAPSTDPDPVPEVSASADVIVPDIGDFEDVEIIEVFVKPGDAVNVEDPLITLESDKATMEVPSSDAGTIGPGGRSYFCRNCCCTLDHFWWCRDSPFCPCSLNSGSSEGRFSSCSSCPHEFSGRAE